MDVAAFFASVRAGIRDADGKCVAGANIVIVIEAARCRRSAVQYAFALRRGAVREIDVPHAPRLRRACKQRFEHDGQIRIRRAGIAVLAREKAMAGTPFITASNAAPTVPEYAMSKPALYPRLIPVSTTSSRTGKAP